MEDFKTGSELEYLFNLEDEVLLYEGMIEKPAFLFIKNKMKLIITNMRIILSRDIMKTTMMITKSKEAFLLNRLSEFENKKAFDSKSVVIHIRQAADEYFHTCTDYRDEVIDLIKRLYKDKLKKNLPIFAPTLTNLGNFCTTQEEANKGLTRMPKRETALEEENIIQEQSADEESKEEDNDFVFVENPQRMSNRIDPELIKRYNNPDAIKLEQERLYNEKPGHIMRK